MPALSVKPISIFAVGKYRETAHALIPLLEGSSFRLCGMLDAVSEYKFTPDRLAVVLRAVFPAPRCFIAGEAISEEINVAAVKVWEEYVEEIKPENPLLVNVRVLTFVAARLLTMCSSEHTQMGSLSKKLPRFRKKT
jgi:hypothetical protein